MFASHGVIHVTSLRLLLRGIGSAPGSLPGSSGPLVSRAKPAVGQRGADSSACRQTFGSPRMLQLFGPLETSLYVSVAQSAEWLGNEGASSGK